MHIYIKLHDVSAVEKGGGTRRVLSNDVKKNVTFNTIVQMTACTVFTVHFNYTCHSRRRVGAGVPRPDSGGLLDPDDRSGESGENGDEIGPYKSETQRRRCRHGARSHLPRCSLRSDTRSVRAF